MAIHFSNNNDDGVMSEINMTPLVDVMLVLLIVFIVTIPVMHHAVPMQLPQASSTPEKTPKPPVRLAIQADGQLFWNGEAIGAANLETRFTQIGAQTEQPAVQIMADRSTRYDAVAQALSAARRTGVQQVGFVTEPAK